MVHGYIELSWARLLYNLLWYGYIAIELYPHVHFTNKALYCIWLAIYGTTYVSNLVVHNINKLAYPNSISIINICTFQDQNIK